MVHPVYKMEVELDIYLVLSTGVKLNALLLQVQCTFTSKNKMQTFREQAALNTCALGCLLKLYESWYFLKMLKVMFIL